MSRVADNPVELPSGVEVSVADGDITVKGGKGTLAMALHELVDVLQEDRLLRFIAKSGDKRAAAMSGTTRSIVSNMVKGVTEGFVKELQLVGVGFRAQVSDKVLNLTLGFSHPILYDIPDGVEVETPSLTRILVRGIDKQLVGQVSAEIRAYRPPEPYKGKGVRYLDEYVKRKEAKKK